MLPPEIRQGDFQQVCLSWHPEMLRSKTPPEETPGEALLEIQLKTQNETIAAVATPPGEGGIAVIRLSGSEAITVAQRLFRPQSKKKDEGNLRARTMHYGRFIDLGKGDMSGVVINGAVREEDGEVIDDGLLTLFPAPNSYTGEDVAELSCHGGRAVTSRLLALLLRCGVSAAQPGEFTLRAFLNGRLDLAQAEAVADIVRARTVSAQRLARRQLDGALSKAVTKCREELIGILAAIEVTIDFSEEVGELVYAPLQRRVRSVRDDVARLLATAEHGRMLREGLRIAIIGRPNVGKSSLLNALLRADRAIVTPIAGTTRDLIEENAIIGGLPVVLIDTAGIRETEDMVESIGVARARGSIETADVVLLTLDASVGITEEDCLLYESLATSETRKIVVLNKCDTLTSAESESLSAEVKLRMPMLPCLSMSALTGFGLEALEAEMARPALEVSEGQQSKVTQGIGQSGIGADGWEDVVVSSARHESALLAAYESLLEAQDTIAQEMPGDFIAIDVRGALDTLGLITGETVTDDIIHRIFQDFCVGK